MVSLIAAVGCVFTACNDDDTNMSRIVLASADVLEYEVLPSGPQIITITSDADWVAEAPAWITVSPASGNSGQTEVEIMVNDNLRENLPDNPRRANVLFKGRNLESIATVIIRQDGDKFRDPIDYTIESIASVEDETMVRLPDMTVVALTSKGFIISDGTSFTYIKEPVSAVTVGQKVNVHGEKHSDSMHMTYVLGESISDAGTGTLPTVTPFDISTTLDQTEGNVYKYVTVTGDFDGTAVSVAGMTNKVYLIDPAADLGVSNLSGHKVAVIGYFAGAATPVVNVIPTYIEDLGVNEVVYFSDDFEWMDPWTSIAGVHDYVAESSTVKAESKNIAGVNADGKKLYDELVDRGYDFVKATYEGKEDRPFETRIYMQKNYLKFSLTGIEAGLVLPKLSNVPSDEALQLCFNWSPMRQGDPGAEGRAYDAISLIVIVENDGAEVKIPVPGHTLTKGGQHEWMYAEIDLSDQTIDENTKITIRSADAKWPTDKVNRWFIDNIKVRQMP